MVPFILNPSPLTLKLPLILIILSTFVLQATSSLNPPRHAQLPCPKRMIKMKLQLGQEPNSADAPHYWPLWEAVKEKVVSRVGPDIDGVVSTG